MDDKSQLKSASQHTYEHYKDKWEKFDVDAALAEVDKQADEQSGQGQIEPRLNIDAELPKPRALPMDAEGWRQRGNEFFKLQDFESALDCYDKSLSIEPSHLAYANRGLVRFKRKDYNASIEDLTKAIQLDNKYVKAYQRRGTTYKALEKYQQSVQDFDMALRLEPENKAILRERDNCLRQILKTKGIQDFESGSWSEVTDIRITEQKVLRSSDQTNENDVNVENVSAMEVCQDENVSVPVRQVSPKSSIMIDQVEKLESNDQQDIQDMKSKSEVKQQPPKSEQQVQQQQLREKQAPCQHKMKGTVQSPNKTTNSSQDDIQQALGTLSKNQISLDQQHSKKPIQKVKVDRGSNATDQSLQQSSDSTLTKKIKVNAKMTSVEFEMAWRNIGKDVQKQTQFLGQIDGDDIPKILKSSLTPALLGEIVNVVLQNMLLNEHVEIRVNGMQLLQQLPRVERFGMTVRCVSSKIKQTWAKNWDIVILSSDEQQKLELQNTRQLYKV
eukprot:TRINITY_DN5757_c0_g1_i5.p1 TRINITY_DN5757_c0_g1~~TRINITY_DN5757_c0_g1_i5.p1  ORF type:complete len:572 (-),score=51.20 TRINITY_DN5757_c0_g1_i5:437-1936(-)